MDRPGKNQRSARIAGILLLGIVLCTVAQAAPELRLSDVLRTALSTNPDIQVQETITEAARGQEMQAAGQFDVMLSSGINYSKQISPRPSAGVDQTQAFSTGYQIGAIKQFRNGASVGTSFDVNSFLDSSVIGAQAPSTATLGVTLTLPLLKGSGVLEVSAFEDAAKLAIRANELGLRDNASQTLYRALSAYWTYSIQFSLQKVAIDSEQRSRDLLLSTQKLVDASEKPRADLVLLRADLADRTVSREAATLAVSEARSALGRLLGIDASAIATLAEPADALPAIIEIGLPTERELSRLRSAAQAHRPDLLALALQGAAAERQAQAAHHQLLPSLNVEVGVSYSKANSTGQHFSFISDTGRLQNGPSVVARLDFQFPLQNTAARGLVRQRDATLDQLSIRRKDLATAIDNGVDIALQRLRSSAGQLKVAKSGLSQYEQAVAQEITKQRNGISTLIDVINVETRFINARTNYLQTYLAYANAIAGLRFETGTLLPDESKFSRADRFELDLTDLTGLGSTINQLVIHCN